MQKAQIEPLEILPWEFIESFPIPAPLVRVPPTNGRACAKSVERAHSRCREE